MKEISRDELNSFVEDSELLLGLAERPGQLLTKKNEIAKFFYKRKWISTSTFLPQAKQFLNNGKLLSKLGIRAPIVNDIYYCKEISAHIVTYDLIEGDDLRELCFMGGIDSLATLPEFLNHLHNEGIYFRAIHLGNVVRCKSGETAIIDISDLSIRSTSLSVFRRARNLAHLIDTEGDQDYFNEYGLGRFLNQYFEAAGLSQWQRALFMFRFDLAIST